MVRDTGGRTVRPCRPLPARHAVAARLLRVYPVGTFLIDIVCPATKTVVWRGAAQAELDLDPKPEQRRVRLEKSVRDILKRFPPKPGQKSSGSGN